MPTSPENVNRVYDGQDTMLRINSFLNPSKLGPQELSWGFNIKTRGGVPRTRDGFNSSFKFTCGKAQGISLFTPTGGLPHLVVAVSGNVYALKFPFDSYFQLTGISFAPWAEQVFFKEALVAKTPTMAVTPYAVLMMQDGQSRAAYWDGSVSRHLDPTPNGYYNGASVGASETVIGTAMEWVAGRLWVIRDGQLFAGDIADPLHFTETQYLTGGSFQSMDGRPFTALRKTSDNQQLIAWSINNTQSLAAGITDRSQWASTQNFQQMLFPGVGCVSAKGPCSVSGEIMWPSLEGIRMYSAVGSSVFNAKNPVASHEMLRSWENRSPNLGAICGGAFDSYVMFGMPIGDVYNKHIWSFDTSSGDLLAGVYAYPGQLPYSWQGVWTGIRPVEFASGFCYNRTRCFCLSQDRDAVRIWEMFDPSERDGGCEIVCNFETKGNTYGESTVAFKRFLHTNLHLEAIRGNPKVTLEYRNEFGCFENMGRGDLCAVDCNALPKSCSPVPPKSLDSQQRYKVSSEPVPDCTQPVPIAPYRNIVGTYHIARVSWVGRLGVRAIKHVAEEYEENDHGECNMNDLGDCSALSCCDQEPDYISCPSDGPAYYSGGCGIVSI